jgi:DNA polymerase/3'-5' exonuclease PolX
MGGTLKAESGDKTIMQIEKRKFPWIEAAGIAAEITNAMQVLCGKGYLAVAGSVRRRKPEVGDVEIVYVPMIGSRRAEGEFFGTPTNAVDDWLDQMVRTKVFAQRLNSLGRKTWGTRIKLAAHVGTGIPVDFFEATPANWWNYLVCRTGPKESNIAICNAALAREWEWHPYSPGFVSAGGRELHAVKSEAEVFEFVGLKYLPPERR